MTSHLQVDMPTVQPWIYVSDLARQIALYAIENNLARQNNEFYNFTPEMTKRIQDAFTKRDKVYVFRKSDPLSENFVSGFRFGKIADGYVFLDTENGNMGLVTLYSHRHRLKLGFELTDGGQLVVDLSLSYVTNYIRTTNSVW